MTDVNEVLASEVRYLEAQNLGSKNISDTVVAIRVSVGYAMQAYTTSGLKHGLSMVRHIGGLTQRYFDLNSFAQEVTPQPQQPSMGRWLIRLNFATRRAEESLGREAIGDTKSHLMTILGIVKGCLTQHETSFRQGYENAS